MAGKFQWKKFGDVDLDDSFFDSLKEDYPEFTEWFAKKSKSGEEALVFSDKSGIAAFLYLKDENEPLELVDKVISACPRVKIGTLRLSERQRGIRLGEGALGVALWKWQEKQVDEIYATVFEKHEVLITLFNKFGFSCIGKNARGECIYLKSRKKIDYSDAYKAFPFINTDFKKAGLLPIMEIFHDRLFPYSELMGNNKEIEEITAGNGITKIYLATPWSTMHYEVGEPICIYRIYDGAFGKTYKSVVTSFGTITKIITIKNNGRCLVPLEGYIASAGNKTVFSEGELKNLYSESKNVVMIEMVYNGYFGKGHNVNHKTLSDNGLFQQYPYNINYSKDQFVEILKMGDTNVQNVILD